MTTDDPRSAPDEVEPGVPATSELTEEQWLAGTADEGDVPMPDRPQGVDQWGTTKREEELGESLQMRVSREEPEEVPADDPEPYLTRSVVDPGPDDGIGLDEEADLVGEIDGGADESLSAEEAALRIVDEAPGATYAPDPGYLDR